MLFGLTGKAEASANAEAYVGQPFGVGRVTIDVLRGEPVVPLSDERFTVLEANNRVFYPSLKQEPLRRLIRGLLDMDGPRKVTIYFLFRGDAPFELSAFTPYEQGLRVRPVNNTAAHRRLLSEWWEQYTENYQQLVSGRAYPPVAENFLVASLSRRLGLAIPEAKRGWLGATSDRQNPLDYLLVNEAHLLRVDRELLTDRAEDLDVEAEIPEAIQWAQPEPLDETLEEVAVEELAKHVPEECFYMRFGTFSNYLWFRDLNKKWQGDLGNMIWQRGIVRGANLRIQQQLSLKDNVLAKIVGPRVIGDAAVIGLDPYAQQGAAIGVIFQAKNQFLLSTDLLNQRRASLKLFDDATEETLEIEGEKVSLISNPTGEVRSYHVQSGEVHMVSTSRTLVERFLQASKGTRSLANLASFRKARLRFPLEREDAMFAFVPEQFWQNLSTPKYVIENLRRVRATREAVMLELAGYAAQCEGQLNAEGEISTAEILPEKFAARFEDSELSSGTDGMIDSLRGKPGYFTPIADMQLGKISRSEAAKFRQLKQAVSGSVNAMPPIAAAVHRHVGAENVPETVTIDVHAQGAIREKLGKFATWIGQPSELRLSPIQEDLIAGEAVVEFPGIFGNSEAGEFHLFGALQEFRSPLTPRRGTLQLEDSPAEFVRGYVGAWPKPGLLQWLTGGEPARGAQPQPIGEMWQAKQDDFLLISFKPEVIDQVLPQLQHIPAERPGQAWLTIQDLTSTQMAENVSAAGYMRTRDASVAGSRMMNALANQLHIPRHLCREVADRLIDGQFVCPLGGEYQLFEPKRGLETWASTALPESNRFLLSEIPEDFQLPLLEWFRGMSGDLSLDGAGLGVHLEIKMTGAAMP